MTTNLQPVSFSATYKGDKKIAALMNGKLIFL